MVLYMGRKNKKMTSLLLINVQIFPKKTVFILWSNRIVQKKKAATLYPDVPDWGASSASSQLYALDHVVVFVDSRSSL